jgi:hypothetical protein
LHDWHSTELSLDGSRILRDFATPAQHGPARLNRGEVTGFVLLFADAPDNVIYVSGDTVWFEGVAEVAKRFAIRTAILHLGAARVPAVGRFHSP